MAFYYEPKIILSVKNRQKYKCMSVKYDIFYQTEVSILMEYISKFVTYYKVSNHAVTVLIHTDFTDQITKTF